MKEEIFNIYDLHIYLLTNVRTTYLHTLYSLHAKGLIKENANTSKAISLDDIRQGSYLNPTKPHPFEILDDWYN